MSGQPRAGLAQPRQGVGLWGQAGDGPVALGRDGDLGASGDGGRDVPGDVLLGALRDIGVVQGTPLLGRGWNALIEGG